MKSFRPGSKPPASAPAGIPDPEAATQVTSAAFATRTSLARMSLTVSANVIAQVSPESRPGCRTPCSRARQIGCLFLSSA